VEEEEKAALRRPLRGPRLRQAIVVVAPGADRVGAVDGEELQAVAEAQVPVVVGRAGRLPETVLGWEAGAKAPGAAGWGR